MPLNMPMEIVTVPVAVATPTITGREDLFDRFVSNLQVQTALPAHHVWIREQPSWGSTETHVRALVRVRNELLENAWKAGFKYAITSDDDDLWDNDHVATLWRTHLEHPLVPIVYALSPPRKDRPGATNPFGAMVNEALLHIPTILGVGGYQYRPGWNEDVLADRIRRLEKGLQAVYTDHPTWHWERGDHLHAIDVYGSEEHLAWQRQKGFIADAGATGLSPIP